MVDVAGRFVRREYRVGDLPLGRRMNCFGSDRLLLVVVLLDASAVGIRSLLGFLVARASAIQDGFLRLEEVAERASATTAAPSSTHLCSDLAGAAATSLCSGPPHSASVPGWGGSIGYLLLELDSDRGAHWTHHTTRQYRWVNNHMRCEASRCVQKGMSSFFSCG
jgi:hypothetical protein